MSVMYTSRNANVLSLNLLYVFVDYITLSNFLPNHDYIQLLYYFLFSGFYTEILKFLSSNHCCRTYFNYIFHVHTRRSVPRDSFRNLVRSYLRYRTQILWSILLMPQFLRMYSTNFSHKRFNIFGFESVHRSRYLNATKWSHQVYE